MYLCGVGLNQNVRNGVGAKNVDEAAQALAVLELLEKVVGILELDVQHSLDPRRKLLLPCIHLDRTRFHKRHAHSAVATAVVLLILVLLLRRRLAGR